MDALMWMQQTGSSAVTVGKTVSSTNAIGVEGNVFPILSCSLKKAM